MVPITPIYETLKRLRRRKYTCFELAETLIARCEAAQPLNALLATDWDQLRRRARKIDQIGDAGVGLAGIPLCFKANIATGVFPVSAATPALMNHAPTEPSGVVKPLLEAGALPGASANMHELSFGITSNNYFTGAVRNPWNHALIPGGSSGGVAVAVASRLMLAGIGTDTGASVRLPAALCGVVGFRPTLGRYPTDRIVPVSFTRDTAGIIAQCVPDVILLDQIISRRPAKISPISLKGLRIGLPLSYFYKDLDADVAFAAELTIRQLADNGVTFIEADIPHLEELNNGASLPIALYEFPIALERYVVEFAENVSFSDVVEGIRSPDVASVLRSQIEGNQISKIMYRKALHFFRPKLQAVYHNHFNLHRLDAILFPTAPLTAKPIGQDLNVMHNGSKADTFKIYVRNVDPSSNAGLPGLTLPVTLTSAGLPVGMEIDGPACADNRLLAIGETIEKVMGFQKCYGYAT
ncbi:indoleacetamide hydrolase (plasmid) [Rhizobium rhizogenes]|uniref:indoleacetamide hydrolase n=1 Tax=Rhizobium rhizogenes TaxID=359 RepID=UPI001571E1BD|nr:indoleacetamide hydrolase [Rhizobium rhizogenes]NTI26898.1 indoleacetamide hydrolase [Rhizobium rhizogenes]QTG10229.1 indoleacetamide hydrolase [Rhizobium rhizogenes]